MKKKVTNYAAFYAILKQLQGADKEQLVDEFTGGRTSSLREMTYTEYTNMIRVLNGRLGNHSTPDLKKKSRSAALHLMQQYGVDTADWDSVNRFCRDERIAGKEFARLTVGELSELSVKLRAMIRKKKSEVKVYDYANMQMGVC